MILHVRHRAWDPQGLGRDVSIPTFTSRSLSLLGARSREVKPQAHVGKEAGGKKWALDPTVHDKLEINHIRGIAVSPCTPQGGQGWPGAPSLLSVL